MSRETTFLSSNFLGDQETTMPVPRDCFPFVQTSQATEHPWRQGDHHACPKRLLSHRSNISDDRTS